MCHRGVELCGFYEVTVTVLCVRVDWVSSNCLLSHIYDLSTIKLLDSSFYEVTVTVLYVCVCVCVCVFVRVHTCVCACIHVLGQELTGSAFFPSSILYDLSMIKL